MPHAAEAERLASPPDGITAGLKYLFHNRARYRLVQTETATSIKRAFLVLSPRLCGKRQHLYSCDLELNRTRFLKRPV